VEDAYDFYKPNLESEYPIVDGKLSISCYLRALDRCYYDYRSRFRALTGQSSFQLDRDVAFACFHSPYSKLVQRSWARLLYNESLSAEAEDPRFTALRPFRNMSQEQSFTDKDLTKALDAFSKPSYNQIVASSQLLSQELGNTYCGSLYANLLSLVTTKTDSELARRRILMFSYGSGLMATMFSLQVRDTPSAIADLARIRQIADVKAKLTQRQAVSPVQFTEALALRERTHSASDYTPVSSGPLFPGTFRLSAIDNLKRRTYARV